MRLKGKRCLITGAAQGIGREIALAFAAEGAEVHATDRDLPKLEGMTCHRLDVTSEADVNAVVAACGTLDVLVNCAGYVAQGTVLTSPPEELERCLDINLRGAYRTIRAAAPAMVARGQGSIINIASVVSTVMAAPDRFAYATSKAAVIGMTLSIAKDFAASGLRCNAISPGTVDTPSLAGRLTAPGAREAFVARQPMGRLGQAAEIAAVAVLLASDEAGFMTGSNVIIDGGMSL